MEKYYLVGSLADVAAEPEKGWYDNYRKQFPCGHRISEFPMDVIVEIVGENVPLNVIFGPAILFARLDLLEALGKDFDKFISLGKLYYRSGEILKQYRTIGACDPLQIRGEPNSKRHFCSQCETFRYYALGNLYILKKDLTGQPLYYETQGGFVVNEEIRQHLRSRHWDKLYIDEIPVLDKPKDGLPEDLKTLNIILPHDLISLVGWRGRPLSEVRDLIKPLVSKYSEELVDALTAKLFEVDNDLDNPLVNLTEKGKQLAQAILGEPPVDQSLTKAKE